MTLARVQLASLLLVGILWSSARAENWGHWRGADGNGIAPNATPPTEWSDTKNVKWKAAIPGRGSSSPVVWGDRVFITSSVPKEGSSPTSRQQYDFVLYALSRATGDIVWERTATTATPSEGTHETNSFASASPTTDGKHIIAHFGSQGIYCFAMDGAPVWQRDLGDMQTRNEFGEGSSPTIAGDVVVVPWDHEGPSQLFALDKDTGNILWKVERDEPTNWSTPLIVTHDGQQQIIMNGQNYARAYDLQSGRELWRCGGQTERPVASAVVKDDVVFITSGFRGAFLGAFRLGGEGDIEGTPNVLWTYERDTPDVASPLLSDGRLYFFKAKTGILTCLDSDTGKPHYTGKRTGLRTTYSSPIAAGGHVYLSDRDGTTIVLRDSDQFEPIAENSIGEPIDATPAPVDQQLFLRGEEHLYCIEE